MAIPFILLRVVCWRLLEAEGSESNAHPVTLRSVTQMQSALDPR